MQHHTKNEGISMRLRQKIMVFKIPYVIRTGEVDDESNVVDDVPKFLRLAVVLVVGLKPREGPKGSRVGQVQAGAFVVGT